MKERIDDFEPLLEMAYIHTSKSIERSVLLRMGFSSIEAKVIVNVLHEHNLLKKGTGHCIYILSKNKNISIQEAGELIQNGSEIDYLVEYFKVYE